MVEPRSRRLAVPLAVALMLLAAPGAARGAAFEGRDGCQLQSALPYQNEGSTTSSLFAPGTGSARAILLFVDYEDAPGGEESTAALADAFGPETERWYNRVSRGRLQLDVEAGPGWRRMPRRASEYDISSMASRDAFLADAVATADPEVDFRRYQFVVVVSARGRDVPETRAWSRPAGGGVATADGTELRWGAWLGEQRAYASTKWPARTLVHELGHTLGLPDLYRYGASTWDAQNADVGYWDTMGWHGAGVQFSAWHQRKLGWLDADQVVCATTEPVRRTLSPLDAADGVKAVAVPTSTSTAYVVESRRRAGEDAELCDGGVLVTRVDAGAPGGRSPVVVRVAREGTPSLTGCGPHAFAGFDRTDDEVCRFEDPEQNVRIEVLARRDEGHDVRVSPLSAPPHPNSAACAEAAPPEPQPEPGPGSEPPSGGVAALTPREFGETAGEGEQPPAVDARTPLGLRLTTARRPRLTRAGALAVTARCDAPCTVRALATIDLPRTARDPILRATPRRARRGIEVRLTLRPRADDRRRLAAQIGRGASLPVRLTLSGRSSDGRPGTASATRRLRR